MNLEEAIEWYYKKTNKSKDEEQRLRFLQTQKQVIELAERAEQTRKVAEQTKQKKEAQQEILRKAFAEGGRVFGQGKASYITGMTTMSATALVTTMSYPNSYSAGIEYQLRDQLEREYRVKLKEEIEKVKKEMKGESGTQVDVDILAQGRKFKLDGE